MDKHYLLLLYKHKQSVHISATAFNKITSLKLIPLNVKKRQHREEKENGIIKIKLVILVIAWTLNDTCFLVVNVIQTKGNQF